MTPDATTTTTAPEAPKGLWAKAKHHILHPELTTSQVAWSFAIGFSMSWNPLLGTHTWLSLGLCFAFKRLHRPLIFLAMFINNPWTMVPYATASAYFGNLLLGRGLTLNLQGIDWKSIGLATFTTRAGFDAAYGMLKPILVPYLLGGFILTALAVPIGYYFMRWLTLRLRAMHLPHLRHHS